MGIVAWCGKLMLLSQLAEILLRDLRRLHVMRLHGQAIIIFTVVVLG
jgi:hypothetical protein